MHFPDRQWAEEFIDDKSNSLREQASIAEVFETEDRENIARQQQALRVRLHEIQTYRSADTYAEFKSLCEEVKSELDSFWSKVLNDEKKLMAVAASANVLLLSLQAFVVGLVCTVIGTSLVRSGWYLAPSSTELARRSRVRRKEDQMLRALAAEPADNRFRYQVMKHFGLSGYHKILSKVDQKREKDAAQEKTVSTMNTGAENR